MTWLSLWPFRILLITLILGGGYLIERILFFSLVRTRLLNGMVPEQYQLRLHFRPAFRITLYAFLCALVFPLFQIREPIATTLSHAINLVLITGITWLVIRGIYFFRDVIYHRFSVAAEDNLTERRVRTQIQYVVRVAAILTFFLGAAAVLLTFPSARRIGTSLIASAGVASLIIGFAAQKSLSNLIAGFQIAFTQPMRLDDVLIVEGEWGRVEEITLTYVSIKLWDLRRLVVPITYFVEKPFQNWTRTSAELMGTAEFFIDFSIPVEVIRQELRKVVERTPLWNKKVCVLQVTDTTENSMKLRALVSANDASKLFDLRCYVRESILNFLAAYQSDPFAKVRSAPVQLVTPPV